MVGEIPEGIEAGHHIHALFLLYGWLRFKLVQLSVLMNPLNLILHDWLLFYSL